jgi:hypothetical protein
MNMADEPIATQDWYTRAIVRVLETMVKRSFDGEYTFRAGDELEMVQWGRAGRAIDRSAWWTSYDIDGAFIIESDNIEIVSILDEVAPIESK